MTSERAYPVSCALAVLMCVGFTGSPVFGDPMPRELRTLPVYTETLTNGAGATWALADAAGTWMILSVTARKLEAEAAPWGAELDVLLDGRPAVRVPIANAQRPPRILYGMIRRRMRSTPQVFLDWDGSYTEALSLDEERFHLMLVSPEGSIVGHVHGATTPENVAAFGELIRAHVPLVSEE